MIRKYFGGEKKLYTKPPTAGIRNFKFLDATWSSLSVFPIAYVITRLLVRALAQEPLESFLMEKVDPVDTEIAIVSAVDIL